MRHVLDNRSHQMDFLTPSGSPSLFKPEVSNDMVHEELEPRLMHDAQGCP